MIESLDRVLFSEVQAVGQCHTEQYQRLLFPIPIQTAHQIILSGLQIILEKLDQLPFQRIHEGFSVQTEFFHFPFENIAHSPNLDFFCLSTTVSRSLNTAQRPPGFLHVGVCLRTTNTEWDGTNFALLRKQW